MGLGSRRCHGRPGLFALFPRNAPTIEGRTWGQRGVQGVSRSRWWRRGLWGHAGVVNRGGPYIGFNFLTTKEADTDLVKEEFLTKAVSAEDDEGCGDVWGWGKRAQGGACLVGKVVPHFTAVIFKFPGRQASPAFRGNATLAEDGGSSFAEEWVDLICPVQVLLLFAWKDRVEDSVLILQALVSIDHVRIAIVSWGCCKAGVAGELILRSTPWAAKAVSRGFLMRKEVVVI